MTKYPRNFGSAAGLAAAFLARPARADDFNFRIVAGSGSVLDHTDGTGANARFFNISGAAVDASGNIYLADTGDHTIREVTPAGVVTTLAGTPGQAGSSDGTGGAAHFLYPYAIAVDGAGNVYVTDGDNQSINRGTRAPPPPPANAAPASPTPTAGDTPDSSAAP